MKKANGFGFSASLKLLKTALDKVGYKNAIEETEKMRKNSGFTLTENEMNQWGYQLISQEKSVDALEIFKLNVYLYPASANAYDSLGEIYAALGDRKAAIRNYEKSLQLNPENKNATGQIRTLKSHK